MPWIPPGLAVHCREQSRRRSRILGTNGMAFGQGAKNKTIVFGMLEEEGEEAKGAARGGAKRQGQDIDERGGGNAGKGGVAYMDPRKGDGALAFHGYEHQAASRGKVLQEEDPALRRGRALVIRRANGKMP